MKNLSRSFLLVLSTVIFFGCASQSTLTVGSDKRIGNDISEFQTYSWISEDGAVPSTQIFLGSQGALVFHEESTRTNIKEAMETQLEAKGFDKVMNNPDMLVGYTVLEQADQLRTYTREGYSYLGEGPIERNAEMVDVEPGTILVNFVDAKTGLQVWQGFASGGLEKSDVDDENLIQSKMEAIFKRFDFSAFTIDTERATR